MSERVGTFDDGARAAAVLAAALILAGCLPSLGFYSREGLVVVVLGGVLACVAVFRPSICERCLATEYGRKVLASAGPLLLLATAYRAALEPRPSPFVAPLGTLALVLGAALFLKPPLVNPLAALLPGLLVWSAGAALLCSKLMYVEVTGGVYAVSYGWIAGLALALLAWSDRWLERAWLRRVLLGGLLAVGLAVRGGAVIASPDPVIDVYSVVTQTPRALLRGENPYRYRIVSPYGTARAERFRMGTKEARSDPEFYTPGIILFCLPAAATGLDPRWLFAACWLALGVIAYGSAQRRHGTAAIPVCLAGLVLLMPSASFTSEQAWIDVVFGLFFTTGMLPLAPPLAGALVGFGLTIKQTTLFCVPAAIYRWRRSKAAILALFGAIAVVDLPFLAWDAREFLKDVMLGYLKEGVRGHAMSIPACILRETGREISTMPLLLVAAVVAVLAARRSAPSIAALTASAGMALALFNLFTRAAFMNYYEVAALLLLISAAMPGVEEPGA